MLNGFVNYSQGNNTYLQSMLNVTPKTPESASLSKFIDIPAGSYTGTTSFSFPLYQIESNGHNFPISLDYHASGIKVGETSGRAGLGWAINICNASLSKQTNGKKDADFITNHNPYTFAPYYYQVPGHDYVTAIEVTNCDGEFPTDTQPDVYSYSIDGESGKFIHDSNGVIQKIPYNAIKIAKNENGTPAGYTFTTTDGVKYKFIYNGVQITKTSSGMVEDMNNFRINEIELINGEKILFNYRI
jgi:hypothetical protein